MQTLILYSVSGISSLNSWQNHPSVVRHGLSSVAPDHWLCLCQGRPIQCWKYFTGERAGQGSFHLTWTALRVAKSMASLWMLAGSKNKFGVI